MRLLVVGVGGTGKSVVKGLIKLKQVDEIFILNRTKNSSKEIVNEFISNKIKVFNKDKIKYVDYVILSLSAVPAFKRKKILNSSENSFEIRRKQLKYNLNAVKKTIPLFKKLKKSTKIIVITNPVDTITYYLSKKLPLQKIFGFGLQLDINRYSEFLKKRILCMGLHGKSIPIVNFPTREKYVSLYEKVDKSFFNYLRKKGLPYNIYEEEFKKYFKKFLSKKKVLCHTSFLFDKKKFNFSVGFPLYLKNGNIVGIKKFKMSKIEEELLMEEITKAKKDMGKYK